MQAEREAPYTKHPRSIAMTRKDFNNIAGIIVNLDVDPATKDKIAADFADKLAWSNPRFDKQRFINAATGMTPIVSPARRAVAAKQAVPMDTYRACSIVEGFSGEEHDITDVRAAWQHLVDTGMAWKLQGWYGRSARALIEAGEITPATPEEA